MNPIYVILHWVISIIFMLSGLLSSYLTAFYVGLPLIFISLVFSPSFLKYLVKKTRGSLSVKTNIFSILLLSGQFIWILHFYIDIEEEKAKDAAIAEIKQNTINYFNINKQQIITSLQKDFEIKDYKAVISRVDRYIEVNDKDLSQLRIKAEKGLEVKQLLLKLEELPEDDIQGRIKNYQALLKLRPKNEKYQEKLADLKKVAEEQRLAFVEKKLKEKESKLLSKLEGLPEDDIQGRIKNYQALLKLRPKNEKYQEKLADLKKVAEEQRLAFVEKKLKEKESKLLSELEELFEDDIQGHIDTYEQLVELFPNNEGYQEKLNTFNKVASERQLFERMKKAWNVHEYTSEKDDSTNVAMAVVSSSNFYEYGGEVIKPTLAIFCSENKTRIYVNWGVYIRSRDTTMEYRLESQQSTKTRTFSISTDYEALGFFGSRAIPFIKSLFDEESITMWVTPYGENTIKAKFEITGLKIAIKPLRKACHW